MAASSGIYSKRVNSSKLQHRSLVNKVQPPVAYLKYGRGGSCHGVAKLKIFIYSFLNDYILRPAHPLKLHSCINTVGLCNAGRVVLAPPSIKTKLWYCDTTRRSVTEQERSLAVSTRPHHYHVIRKGQSELLRLRQKNIQKFGLRRV